MMAPGYRQAPLCVGKHASIPAFPTLFAALGAEEDSPDQRMAKTFRTPIKIETFAKARKYLLVLVLRSNGLKTALQDEPLFFGVVKQADSTARSDDGSFYA
jgi:hypothetical protein